MKGIFLAGSLFLLGCGPSAGGGDNGSGNGGTDGSVGQPVDASNNGSDAAACLSAAQNADAVLLPVDIIWVVDTSGSMNDEANEVQNALNDFSNFIAASGIDYHVVLIADAGAMTVPPPLGGSAEFMHVNQVVGSTDALEVVYNSYASFSSFLRPNASTHFVVVTDDESDWSQGQFESMIGQFSNASLSNYTFHSICSEPQVLIPATPPFPAIMGPCTGGLGSGNTAAAPGDTYIAMSAATGGLWSSICSTDWNPTFNAVAAAVSDGIALPCTYQIPEPPVGETLDPERVNFVYTTSSGATETVPNVGTEANCTAAGGWYYDNPVTPTQILVCPTTCTILEANQEGDVDIEFGCATIVD